MAYYRKRTVLRPEDIEGRNSAILRRRSYLLVLWQLRVASLLLQCAEDGKSGADHVTCLWCASGRLANARRVARRGRIKLSKRIGRLERKCARFDMDAGICEAFDNIRNMRARWHESTGRLH